MASCVSGKRIYETQAIAEDVLIETWSRYEFNAEQGPLSVYRCDDCGQFHLTSRGPMNERLTQALRDGTISRQREARRWEQKFRKR